MTFKLKSGNRTSFKGMGSSPAKSHDGTKSTTTHYEDGSPKSKREQDFSERHETELAKENQNWPGETEGQDENKIFNKKGEHIGDWVNSKKVMHKIPNDDNRPKSKSN